MKKTYELRVEGKNSDRLLETAKSDVRKYIKRCREKDLPTGKHFWHFMCRIGTSEESAVDVHPQQLTEVINATVAAGATQLFAHIEPVATARVYKNVAEPWTPADEQTNAAGEDASQ
jgi:hypothetical protein